MVKIILPAGKLTPIETHPTIIDLTPVFLAIHWSVRT